MQRRRAADRLILYRLTMDKPFLVAAAVALAVLVACNQQFDHGNLQRWGVDAPQHIVATLRSEFGRLKPLFVDNIVPLAPFYARVFTLSKERQGGELRDAATAARTVEGSERAERAVSLEDLWARNVRGAELRAELHKFAAENHTVLEYRQVWDSLEALDKGDDIYTGTRWAVGKSVGMRCGKEHEEPGRAAGRCFNREHVWPKSWWGGFEKGGAASTDLFALYLVDEYANSQRGNLPFGNVRDDEAVYRSPSGAKMGPCQESEGGPAPSARPQNEKLKGKVKFFDAGKRFGFVRLPDGRDVYVSASNIAAGSRALNAGDRVSLSVTHNNKQTNNKGSRLAGREVMVIESAPDKCFEPPDVVKGDLARALFYISVRYMGVFLCCDNQAVSASRLKPAMESLLRRWHHQDPVSSVEKARARSITADWQHNANPFVLFPGLVDRVEDF